MTTPPASIGARSVEVETPALIIDLDAFERNLDRMTDSLRGAAVRLRPHAKTHKCPAIARQQVARGAIGVCCQTLGEAEAMILGGVENVLITNEIVSPGKIVRLAAIAKQAEVMVCADDERNVVALNTAAQSFGVRLGVLVEVNIGQDRCGVAPGEPAVALARGIASSAGLRFAGIHAYQGKAQHIYESAERAAAMETAISKTKLAVDALNSSGLACEIVTGAGTGTYEIEAASGVYNEIQAGSYIFMDVDYSRVEGPPRRFENALFVATTVLSRSGGRVICDAGLKASSIDSGLPVVRDRPSWRFVGASDEHGEIHILDGSSDPCIGDSLWLIPGHCDPTVNLHDWFVGIRNDRVEALWPISARGAR